ncbi:hypothetical protein E1262_11380 [Jiangella aurantiaca]|uniref:Uncharacterized protein n=1 Tax=Jiangella aurantiaca TaxID=2530373 RepID=A0A4R5ABU5_9ACTN|nr:hypothetical protein [Jiangella aurantiaca]TDD69868.1 hypothetical protein E1262_11380 [Jiangella aurantiaca]
MTEPAAAPRRTPSGPFFWTCLVAGAGIVGYGLVGAWGDRADTHPADLAVWLGGAGVAHDAVVAPAVIVVALGTRWLPRAARLPVRLGLALTALLTVLFWPVVRGWGRSPSVPSALPLEYGRNLLVVLALIWLVVGAVVTARWRRERRPAG